MKNVILICFAFGAIAMNAQEPKHEMNHQRNDQMTKMDLNPEQIADLKTKKMVLQLDLNEGQQKEIYSIFSEEATMRKQMKDDHKNKKELSSDERHKMMSAKLDKQIVMKKRMKTILSPEQYKKWELEINSNKRSKKSRDHRKT